MGEGVEAFAVAAPGLAPMVAAELDALGVGHEEPSAAGVGFRATQRELYKANLHLRVASRVLVRLATFRAAHFSELEKGVSRVAWERWLAPDSSVALRVTSRKSRLYHSGAVAERLVSVLEQRQLVAGTSKGADEEGEGGQQLLIVRVDHDQCTLSIDSSGELLHRRGYRQAVAKAPLRETLAAAMLHASCADDVLNIMDPMCGSGTIPIEAALRARRIPPGWKRSFAFQRWPDFDDRVWRQVRDTASARILRESPVVIRGSDRDAGAVTAAKANAERAGVASDIDFMQRPLSEVQSSALGRGLLILNPPYGERVSAGKELRDLYARVGDVARGRFAGWSVGILAADPKLIAQTRLQVTRRFSTTNGGIRVGYWAMG